MDPQPEPVGRAFTGPAVELALASYPGFTMTAPPQQPTPYGVYRPEYVDRARSQHTVVHADGRREVVADPTEFVDGRPRRRAGAPRRTPPRPTRSTAACRSGRSCTRAPATRAATPTSACGSPHDGDPRSATRGSPGWPSSISPRKVRELVPEAADLDVEVYVLPNLGARQRGDPRTARPGRRRVDAVRPAGQGPRRVGAVAGRARSRRTCCERRDAGRTA